MGPMSLLALLSVALGGAIGASLRFAFGLWAARTFGSAFPVGTLGVNVVGGFAMGLAAVALIERGGGPVWLAPALTAGLLGGFTTFSAFALDAVLLIERGEALRALAYVLLSVALSIGALALGLLIARSFA